MVNRSHNRQRRIYVIGINTGRCKVCKKKKDLRCGSCYECAPKVSGEAVPGGHRLWETDNPANEWYYIEHEKETK